MVTTITPCKKEKAKHGGPQIYGRRLEKIEEKPFD